MKNTPKAGEVVELKMYIHLTENGEFRFFNCDMSEYEGVGVCLGEETVSFVMPACDILKAMVSSLEEQIKTERANHHVKITQLEDKIQQLLAIGHDGGVN